MTSKIAKAGIAALIALGAISATAGSAAAGPDIGLGIVIGGPGYYDGPFYDDGPRYDRGPRHHGRHEGWRAPPRRVGCAPFHAVEKARWNGLHRAHVQDVTPRRVVIGGYRDYGFDRMVFANAPGCPIIRD
ncbi:hypothetical protein HGO38_00200 [Rhizobium sp. CG5]|uniref:hypothetical protein n=1 Tax=Rhizobium sp. CG5 TaxID=2726076 RepID=UPI0020332563|nr:hypothetical protein [Rhizobium sp. CG5]MCM2471902.1 hypothetical protein [Rhizobium sp. CG5]